MTKEEVENELFDAKHEMDVAKAELEIHADFANEAWEEYCAKAVKEDRAREQWRAARKHYNRLLMESME